MPTTEKYNVVNNAAYSYLRILSAELLKGGGVRLNNISEYTTGISEKERKAYISILTILEDINTNEGTYNSSKNYQALYKQLHEHAEKLDLDIYNKASPGLLKFHAHLFIGMYENDNKLHHDISQNVIKKGRRKTGAARVAENIQKGVKNNTSRYNPLHPNHVFSMLVQGTAGIANRAMHDTNVTYVSYSHEARKNLRFGTQVKDAKREVYPAFKQFLAAKQYLNQINSKDKKYNHVYINLQKTYIPDEKNIPRLTERLATDSLHGLNNADLGVAVITLPADGKFFYRDFDPEHGYSRKKHTDESLRFVLDECIDSIQHNKNDFYLSEDVRRAVFGDIAEEKDKIKELFWESVEDVLPGGLNGDTIVDPAQRQAILFHFIKFHLTDHILNKLEPSTYNISCKDNIDRGGVHNLWYEYNLKLRDKSVARITQEEFERDFYSSALLVKERAINHHRTALWNVLYHEFTTKPELFVKMDWVGDWLKDNAVKPKNYQQDSTHAKSKEYRERLKNIENSKSALKEIMTEFPPAKIDGATITTAFAGKKLTMQEVSASCDSLRKHYDTADIKVKEFKEENRFMVHHDVKAESKIFPDIDIVAKTEVVANKSSVNTQQFMMTTTNNHEQNRNGMHVLAQMAGQYSLQNNQAVCTIHAAGSLHIAYEYAKKLTEMGVKFKFDSNTSPVQQHQIRAWLEIDKNKPVNTTGAQNIHERRATVSASPAALEPPKPSDNGSRRKRRASI
jgi:hypothetical protein